jgi:gamma-glutamyl-gamma-aminobutyrate hydrolase PuuD
VFVLFVVAPKTVLGLSYHPLMKSSKNKPKKPHFKVFVVFVVGPKFVLGLSYHPLTKSSKNSLKKTSFKVFLVFVVDVCGVCGRPQNRFGSIISSLDEI